MMPNTFMLKVVIMSEDRNKDNNKDKSRTKVFKVKRAYFNAFKKEFLRWQKEFGLMQYQIQFEHKDADGAYAKICVHEDDKFAHVICNNKYSSQQDANTDMGPESHAKHEACHLLISRLEWLANQRCIREDEIYDEDEAIVVRLTRILK